MTSNPNISRVPQGEPRLDELDKFKAMLLATLTTGRDAIIRCNGESEAKKLRRRFYLLRDKLDAFEREAADCCTFEVVGIRVLCRAKPEAPLGNDWTHRITIGAEPNATDNQGNFSPSN